MENLEIFNREYCLGCIHGDTCVYRRRLKQFGNSECIVTKHDRFTCSRYKKSRVCENITQDVIFEDLEVFKYDIHKED